MGTVVTAIIVWVAIAIIARLNIPILSPIFRVWWNLSFTIAACIPFCGWMSHFIITQGDEQAKKAKEEIVKIGEETDGGAIDSLAESAKRSEEERIAREERQRAEREALQEELRADAYRAIGTRDVTLNSDGSMVKVGNGDYIPVEEFKKDLR